MEKHGIGETTNMYWATIMCYPQFYAFGKKSDKIVSILLELARGAHNKQAHRRGLAVLWTMENLRMWNKEGWTEQ